MQYVSTCIVYLHVYISTQKGFWFLFIVLKVIAVGDVLPALQRVACSGLFFYGGVLFFSFV
jgi:hypothetical protein